MSGMSLRRQEVMAVRRVTCSSALTGTVTWLHRPSGIFTAPSLISSLLRARFAPHRATSVLRRDTLFVPTHGFSGRFRGCMLSSVSKITT